MMRCFSVLAFVLVALPVAAQEEPPAQPPSHQQRKYPEFPAQPKGRITGTVLCADTHHPARGAIVLAIPINTANINDLRGELNGTQNSVRVGMDGTYLFTKVYPGDYTVLVMFPGYLSPLEAIISVETSDLDTDAKSPGASTTAIHEVLLRNGSVTVHGDEMETFNVSLQRGAAVSGRVFYSDGSPATQVSVAIENTVDPPQKTSLYQQVEAATVRGMLSTQSLFTDDQGHYRIAGIQPGTYRIATVASQKSSFKSDDNLLMAGAWSGMFDPSAIHTYAGDTVHKKAAKTFELRPGDELSGIDITIPIDAFHRVSGLIAAKDGRPVNSAGLTLADHADESVTFSATASRDGTFQFPAVPAGTYTLTAKRAKIFKLPPNVPDNVLISDSEISNIFADASMSIIVKDSDLTGISLALTEVPLPADAKPSRIPQTPQ